MNPVVLHHFSEDPSIERLLPHVPRTSPSHSPAVWAIDDERAPLYWFPRDCPRVAIWPRHECDRGMFTERFTTSAAGASSPSDSAATSTTFDAIGLHRSSGRLIGLEVPDFDARLHCCALHIGLEHLGYNAYLGDLDTLRLTDERMAHLLE